MKILTYTSLFPSAARPRHGVFVEQRLRHVLDTGDVEAEVVAPIPWFPFTDERFGVYSSYARTPREDHRGTVRVRYPRYVSIPKIGMHVAPTLMALGTGGTLDEVMRSGFDFDLIDAHYLYPDGVAAERIGRRIGKPVVLTARGSDVNVLCRFVLPRSMIREACLRAAAVTTVSVALKKKLEEIGVPSGKIVVLPNGVDLSRFRPAPRSSNRDSTAGRRAVILSVGNLIAGKGHHLVIDALRGLPGYTLVIAGDGPMRAALMAQVRSENLGDRVRFLGNIAHDEMPSLYGTADVLVLASSTEGMPNVVLEALACGCPVVATEVGGIPEVLTDPQVGTLISERTVDAVVDGVRRVEEAGIDRNAVRRFAERFDWSDTVRRQVELFRDVMS